MTSALRRSPSQVTRESRRFQVLVAQRLRLLHALEELDRAACESGRIAGSPLDEAVSEARRASAQVRGCRIVPVAE